MSAFIVIRIKTDDPSLLQPYQMAARPVIESFGGRFIVRGGSVVTLEGPEESRRIVIIEFPSLKDAKACYHSEEYSNARKLRENIAEAEFIAVEGVE